MEVPHPIPYQGSKRSLAPLIARYIPNDIEVLFEPFAGSAAMSLWIAAHRAPRKIVLGDSLGSMAELWRDILSKPDETADRYELIWRGQQSDNLDYFNEVRSRYNEYQDPVDLLYLVCRCVKNAVRFNAKGAFTQSVDKRRLGMQPGKMRVALRGAGFLLRGITEVRSGDWLNTVKDAGTRDFVYMDPPYLGTSVGRDKRYAEWMSRDRLVAGLEQIRKNKLRFCLSYDGRSGDREYGPPLPDSLGMTHMLLPAGRSTQATLNGVFADTFESLYLSHGVSLATTALVAMEKDQPTLQLSCAA